VSTGARPRLAAARRALVGAAWVLAWMVVWGSALLVFDRRAQAAPPSSSAAVSMPVPHLQPGAPRAR
jgi:hypothetical protein